ncbi:MAG: hypothetical protein KDA45_09250 [Planctomycetales bacterium]|nr:hypothetical protein [Planctomycetales bacterium]
MKILTSTLLALGILLGSVTAAARADWVPLTLTLDAANSSTNQLSLLIAGATPATTDLSGTIDAAIDIDWGTGAITGLELTGGTITSTPWSITIPLVGTAQSSGVGATTDTPSPPGGVTGTTFTASEHQLILNSGEVTLNGASIAGGNFGTTPLEIDGTGDGTLTATAAAGGAYDIFLSMRVDQQESVGGVPLQIAGNVVARGTVTAIPEPASCLLLSLAGCAALFQRRRSQRV